MLELMAPVVGQFGNGEMAVLALLANAAEAYGQPLKGLLAAALYSDKHPKKARDSGETR